MKIKFEEKTWMKSYIEKNIALRMKAKNAFEKDFFKPMNNSVFGIKQWRTSERELTFDW